MKTLVEKINSHAFVTVNDVQDVIGAGGRWMNKNALSYVKQLISCKTKKGR
ncbi:DUF2179 domain-containing protein [Halalkalibacter sp. AB-rgal2]|uniref:DUF2179 domain-containing protein n=1 Tax=Halalkalibacter sp. AB-rgal2 TaxID=3242695 RepID=UPI00359CBAF1